MNTFAHFCHASLINDSPPMSVSCEHSAGSQLNTSDIYAYNKDRDCGWDHLSFQHIQLTRRIS